MLRHNKIVSDYSEKGAKEITPLLSGLGFEVSIE
jgi:hypothetical protein